MKNTDVGEIGAPSNQSSVSRTKHPCRDGSGQTSLFTFGTIIEIKFHAQ